MHYTIALDKQSNKIIEGHELTGMNQERIEQSVFVCPFCGIRATPRDYHSSPQVSWFSYDKAHGQDCKMHDIPPERRIF